MGFLSRIFGRQPAGGPSETVHPPCPHATLIPRWDRAEEIGVTERVANYVCESCHATFSREEGEVLLAHAAERLRAS